MNIVVAGECEKHDFMLVAAVLLKNYFNNEVMIISDNSRHYQYFEGEVSGVKIADSSATVKPEIVLYDWHHGYPEGLEDEVVAYATTYERQAMENVDLLLNQKRMPAVLLVIEEECGLGLKYIDRYYPVISSQISYISSPERKIDWVHDGRVNLKVDKDFAEAVNDFLVEFCNVPKVDIKRLWQYARKRG
ncbi:hypothetical protein [Paenibacillus monticola]|uniref:Uncharacterized protein n=1 Tax=Paenibacillus monticola TaxID=2666075 RepID=A0A7X2H3S6_9BACL|nr:hypothetical protein [Paenibacillus monticola]MRN53054.1 hypothetical protein [Paenibacillus monticola]